ATGHALVASFHIEQLLQHSIGQASFTRRLLQQPFLKAPNSGLVVHQPIHSFSSLLPVNLGQAVFPVSLLMEPKLADFVQLLSLNEVDLGVGAGATHFLLGTQQPAKNFLPELEFVWSPH